MGYSFSGSGPAESGRRISTPQLVMPCGRRREPTAFGRRLARSVAPATVTTTTMAERRRPHVAQAATTRTERSNGTTRTYRESDARGSCTAQAPLLSWSGYVLRTQMPRQREEVALPEQAINRGLEAYHRGRRSQAFRHILAAEPGAVDGYTRPAGHSLATVPTLTYLSHRADLLPTPRLDGRKRRKHGNLRHLDQLGLRRLTAELARSTLKPRQVSRTPGNPHLPGHNAVGAGAEFERPSAAFCDEMHLRQIVDPDRR